MLTVHCQEGFDDDEVVVRKNGEIVATARGVTTSPFIGLATTLTFEAQAGYLDLEIGVPTRQLDARIGVIQSGEAHVAVSLPQGVMDVALLPEPPGHA
jgi:hypothetical protein